MIQMLWGSPVLQSSLANEGRRLISYKVAGLSILSRHDDLLRLGPDCIIRSRTRQSCRLEPGLLKLLPEVSCLAPASAVPPQRPLLSRLPRCVHYRQTLHDSP